jgi:deoxyribose-phosphate aldolase
LTIDTINYYSHAIRLIDLTSLNNNDSHKNITDLCNKAKSPQGNVATVCVYPKFIKTARSCLDSLELNQVKITTVCNFPHGNYKIETVLAEIETAISLGANEIDVVIPYNKLIANKDTNTPYKLLRAAKEICESTIKLKAIIESGVLQYNSLITDATYLSIDAGVDFIKTSTGKVPNNASLASAECILNAIKKYSSSVGFKASGGIKLAEEAIRYLQLAENIMGKNWISVDRFRFGASSLLDSLVRPLKAT